MNHPPFQLESPDTPVEITRDRRPHMPEPLPVRLISVADVVLPMTTGLELEMDTFYVGLWGFEREQAASDDPRQGPAYRAENFALRFHQVEGLVQRDGYRPLQVEIPSLLDAERKLIAAEVDYTRQRGLTPGHDHLSLLDPAGNMIELVEARAIM